MAEETSKMKIKAWLKLPLGRLILCLIFILITSFAACLVNTSGFSVSVSRSLVDMDAFYTSTYAGVAAAKKPTRLTIGKNGDGMVNAKMAAYIYKPNWVDASHPAPAICLTHGYLNSKEMQEAPAIEMARRGYVVYEFDQYDHGDSTWNTPAQFNFYVWSAYDAVEYMYAQPYVLKAADGTGMIAVSGHSMGGFSSELAVAWDEMNFAFGRKSYRMLSAALAVGADFRYDDAYVKGYSGGAYATTYATYNTRTVGTIAAEYDEFFFNSTAKATVIHKDFVSDPAGYGMLGLTKAGEVGKFYKVNPATGLNDETMTAGYGERIIYQPKGDHPYNTWSPEVTGNMVDFYNHAFAYQSALHSVTLPSQVSTLTGAHQTWWLKEVFTCLGLIGFVAAMIYGLKSLFVAPFFSGAVDPETKAIYDGTLALRPTPAPEATPAAGVVVEEKKKGGSAKKGIGILLSVLSGVLSFLLIPAFMDRSADEGLTKLNGWLVYLIWTIIFLGVLSAVAYLYLKAKGGDEAKAKSVFSRLAVALACIGTTGLVLKWVITTGTTQIMGSTNAYWDAPSVNTIAYWAIASGIFGLLMTFITYFTTGEHKRPILEELGLKANWKQVGIAALIAVIITLGAYLVVLLNTLIFGTDFRVYTYAFKVMTGNAFVATLRYIPMFFIFYLCAGIGIASISQGKKSWVADTLAIVVETAPCAFFLLYQYGTLESTGTAAYPSFALSGILVQGLIPTLIILALLQRKTLKATGNIWTGVFTNTFFFTLITLANTTVYSLAQ
jgi:hypothetical protein